MPHPKERETMLHAVTSHFHPFPTQYSTPSILYTTISLCRSPYGPLYNIYSVTHCVSKIFRGFELHIQLGRVINFGGFSLFHFYKVHGIGILLCCVVLRCVGISLRHSHIQGSDNVQSQITTTHQRYYRFILIRIHREHTHTLSLALGVTLFYV